MNDLLVETVKKQVSQVFNFLNTVGYSLIFEGKDNDSFKFTFNNEKLQKKITINVTHSERTKAFFLIIYITNEPYKTVNDYVSFSEYLKKNGISDPSNLESINQTTESIEKYIEEYATLLKKYGMELITTSKQLPGYYPDWT